MVEIINIDIYLNTVVVAAGIDAKEFDMLYYDNVTKFTNEEYERIRKDIVDENSCNGLTAQLDNGNVFVFIRKGQERIDLTVAHELFHATHNILKHAGVEIGENGESYAYLIGWLTNEYYYRLEKSRSKGK